MKEWKECVTCRMPLTPHIDEEGFKRKAPKDFCDLKCKRMLKLYPGVFKNSSSYTHKNWMKARGMV